MEEDNRPYENYYRIIDEALTREILAVLLSESVLINTCRVCSERFVPYENMCDHKCTKHILEWLSADSNADSSFDDFVKLLQEYVDKEEL